MATNLETRSDAYVLTRFYGGEQDRTCVQVNSSRVFENVRLTREQAAQLAQDLMAFADGLELEDYS